jgi:hypothetical protein
MQRVRTGTVRANSGAGPAPPGGTDGSRRTRHRPWIRGLHSSTFQLNVSTVCPMCWGALLV